MEVSHFAPNKIRGIVSHDAAKWLADAGVRFESVTPMLCGLVCCGLTQAPKGIPVFNSEEEFRFRHDLPTPPSEPEYEDDYYGLD